MIAFLLLLRRTSKWTLRSSFSSSSTNFSFHSRRTLRSKAVLETLIGVSSNNKTPPRNLVLYNYPSFSGALSALFAHLHHSRLGLPHLVIPFSSVAPLRVKDLIFEGLETCYLLDFIGPDGFAAQLSRFVPKVIAFDHCKCTRAKISKKERNLENLELHIDTERCSARSVYDYFSMQGKVTELLEGEVCDRMRKIVDYVEDGDLQRWALPDVKAFNTGIKEERERLNCVANPYLFDELMEMDADILIAKGNSYICSRREAAKKLLHELFRLRLGRGFYGECLGMRVDGNSDLSHEIGEELSIRSREAGLRPIGAVIFKQRRSLKMCLRSTDNGTDTSEIAKAYGGGGSSASSSFIIGMDEYNQWCSLK
ncbi:hypothetical protein QJS04_geneDACA006476 [Acorus gramineus]|uniref:Uncharacterized protein n=1 Tax=Acorus gramineus TaxID=55184 RepID=A0AAV9AUU5_ACOGR|nr:hypothetical protein QJS04_geneDACA006476 [Acorus gramineus]